MATVMSAVVQYLEMANKTFDEAKLL